MGISTLQVTNPVSTSVYTWSTIGGNFVSSTTGTTTQVDKAGTYVVTQKLQSGCSDYATDTVVVRFDSSCVILQNYLLNFDAKYGSAGTQIKWTTTNSSDIKQFEVERSFDGVQFETIDNQNPQLSHASQLYYTTTDNLNFISAPAAYYRLKVYFPGGESRYSRIVQVKIPEKENVILKISPNPVHESIRMNVVSKTDADLKISIYNSAGVLFKSMTARVPKGSTFVIVNDIDKWPDNVYNVQIIIGKEKYTRKVVLIK
jgi:hypothetical protein